MKIFVVTLLVALMITATAAQDKKAGREKPNFSGLWIVDLEKSSGIYEVKELRDYVITIDHRDDRVTMKDSYFRNGAPKSVETILFTDRRGETNRSVSERFEMVSTSFWRGNTLTRSYKFQNSSGSYPTSVVEEYRLSKDKNTLIIDSETTVSVPIPPERRRMVLRRKS